MEHDATVPDKSERPRAFDYSRHRYQWRSGRMPERILRDGKLRPTPFDETAIFVVHGIGDQADTDTAVAMRWGIEDALPMIEPGMWRPSDSDRWILPAPYINDGHWAKYDDLTVFSEDIDDDLDTLTRRQLAFFRSSWRSRTRGWWRSWWWIVGRGGRLVRKTRGYRRVFYSLLTVGVGLIIFAAGAWPRSRRFVVTYVNDARLYMEPRGDLEHEIVQLIDRRVARAFLKTIGLDMDLRKLPDYEGVLVGGQPAKFKRVVWAAHSLGTVISFNVVGDILWKCWKVRCEENEEDPTAACETVAPVEKALAAFVTFGSPIDKVCFLYDDHVAGDDPDDERRDLTGPHALNSVFRRWPRAYLPNGPLDVRRNGSKGAWWTNFFYGSDPISGPLDSIEARLRGKPVEELKPDLLIDNVSTLGWRLPIASHNAYWKDCGLATTILERAYCGYTKDVKLAHRRPKDFDSGTQAFFRCWPRRLHAKLSSIGLFLITVFVATLITAGIVYWRVIFDGSRSLSKLGGG